MREQDDGDDNDGRQPEPAAAVRVRVYANELAGASEQASRAKPVPPLFLGE